MLTKNSCSFWSDICGVCLRELTAGVEVVFTKDSDADLFIMAEAKALRQAGAPRVVVVTGDSEISASLEYGSAMGWMTSEMYMLEMKRVRCPSETVTVGSISLTPACLCACSSCRGVHARSSSAVSACMRNDSFHRCMGVCIGSVLLRLPKDTEDLQPYWGFLCIAASLCR